MATVEEVARDLLAAVGSEVGFLTSIKWIDNRYKQIVSRSRFRHLRKVGELIIPARYNTGTIALTRDSTAGTGTDTVWTDIGSGAQEYYYLRQSVAWYHLSSITDDTNLVLTTAFAEDTVTTGAYNIIKRHHPLNSNARWLGRFVHSRLRNPLDSVSPDALDIDVPGRTLVGSYPLQVAQVGTDSSNNIIVEFYPYCNESEIIHYVYWDLPTTLTISSTIPPQIDPYVLKEGALVDLYRYLAARAAHTGQIETAAYFRNESRAQETQWERRMQEASATDKGLDDTEFILKMLGRGHRTGDIRNAHDQVYSRWSPPG